MVYRILINEDMQRELRDVNPQLYDRWHECMDLCYDCADALLDGIREEVAGLEGYLPEYCDTDFDGTCQICGRPAE